MTTKIYKKIAANDISSKVLVNKVIDQLNKSRKVILDQHSLIGFRVEHPTEDIDIEEFIEQKNRAHEFLKHIMALIDIEPLPIGYIIKVFTKEFGLLGAAYLSAALYTDYKRGPNCVNDLVHRGELFFPAWEGVAAALLRLLADLPNREITFVVDESKDTVFGELIPIRYQLIAGMPIHITWGGKRLAFDGMPVGRREDDGSASFDFCCYRFRLTCKRVPSR